ncbi:MAG: SUMF1/EgtB/PvdO family nonheme iron enzyme [Anaerolineae bacterium]|nr:SUMF1/EgtB/PvdO family nonheme iron enzyme [Anaerolineae bacterium]MBL8107038.1 SUMF1/EgtB/PvdO family nonheme iron enzyme [Anaerolineales bacterium]MCC7191027.1 SUMF1/EgtB/PvdO family nonheme iron enzyme [Anaerolineales bacterium]
MYCRRRSATTAQQVQLRKSYINEPLPVGSFSQGANDYSVLDLAGNVWEWAAEMGIAMRRESVPRTGVGRPQAGMIPTIFGAQNPIRF